MPLLAVTRLRVRSLRFAPEFLWLAFRSKRQARNAEGCLGTGLQREKFLVFWTRTVWRDEAAMRAYMTSGVHRKAMPKLQHWCDEASVVHWNDTAGQLPDWKLVREKMRDEGRLSRVRHPSQAQRKGVTAP